MCFRDCRNVPVNIGDIVVKGVHKYIVRFIASYPIVTVIIAEKCGKTHKVETFQLRDVTKI